MGTDSAELTIELYHKVHHEFLLPECYDKNTLYLLYSHPTILCNLIFYCKLFDRSVV